MTEIVSAFDIIQALVCCDNGLRSCNVDVAYENDPNVRNNAVIFVNDTVLLNGKMDFTMNVRGFATKGKSTARIVGEIIKYQGLYQELVINGKLYVMRFWFDNITGSGADDSKRTIMVLTVQIRDFKIRNEE